MKLELPANLEREAHRCPRDGEILVQNVPRDTSARVNRL